MCLSIKNISSHMMFYIKIILLMLSTHGREILETPIEKRAKISCVQIERLIFPHVCIRQQMFPDDTLANRKCSNLPTDRTKALALIRLTAFRLPIRLPRIYSYLRTSRALSLQLLVHKIQQS